MMMMMMHGSPGPAGQEDPARKDPPLSRTLRETVQFYMIDFQTPLGKAIDISIIFLNLLLVAIFVVDTYNISSSLRDLLWKLEILIVAIFICEYVLRLYGAPNRRAYVRDIYSIIDLVAIMPTMILIALPASVFIYDIRVIQTIRVLAVFRIFRFLRFIAQYHLFFGIICQGMVNVARLVVSIIIIFFVYSGLFYFVESPSNQQFCLEFFKCCRMPDQIFPFELHDVDLDNVGQRYQRVMCRVVDVIIQSDGKAFGVEAFNSLDELKINRNIFQHLNHHLFGWDGQGISLNRNFSVRLIKASLSPTSLSRPNSRKLFTMVVEVAPSAEILPKAALFALPDRNNNS